MRLLIPLFSPTTGTWGGLTRVIAIAEAAQKAGHQIAFCASGYLFRNLKSRGYKVYEMPESTLFGLPKIISQKIERRSQNTSLPVKPGRDFGNIWFVLLLSGMAKKDFLRKLVLAETDAMKDFQADTIFTDLDPGAFMISKIHNIPISAAYQTPMESGIGSMPWKIMNYSINKILSEAGLPKQPIEDLFHGKQVLKIIPSIPELEDRNPNQNDICYVGHLLGDIKPNINFPILENKHYVFVYVGTGAVSMKIVKEVLPLVFSNNNDTICLVGSQGIEKEEKIGSVIFQSFVPAREILPYCDWVICHGGQNTIIQALMAGVPLMVFPGPIFERRFNARKVQSTGAGSMGELPDFNAFWIKNAMQYQQDKARHAQELGSKIRSYGSAEKAIKESEKWGK